MYHLAAYVSLDSGNLDAIPLRGTGSVLADVRHVTQPGASREQHASSLGTVTTEL